MTNRHTLAVLVENKPGVLTRVAALFARRAFNIKSLAVGETEHPEISRMTIIVDADSAPIEQVVKQLNKLINVLKVVELEPEDSVERRLLLMKVQADDHVNSGILQVQRVRVTLRTVTNDGNLLGLDQRQVCAVVVDDFCHFHFSFS